MSMIQDLHDAGKDVYSTINIFEAEGSQLDDIFGNFLDVERELGETDDDYRNRIIAKTSQLSRSGEIAVMKSTFLNLLDASTVSLYEYQPAAFYMVAEVATIPSDSDLESVKTQLIDSKQGGNNMTLAVNDSVPFEFGEFASTQPDSPNGFSGPVFTDGGTLSTGF